MTHDIFDARVTTPGTLKEGQATLDADIEIIRAAVETRDADTLNALIKKASKELLLRVRARFLHGANGSALDLPTQNWFEDQGVGKSDAKVLHWGSAMANWGGPTQAQIDQVRDELARGEWAPWQAFQGTKSALMRGQVDVAEVFFPHVAKIDYISLISDTTMDFSADGMMDFSERMVTGGLVEQHVDISVNLIKKAAMQGYLGLAKRTFSSMNETHKKQAARGLVGALMDSAVREDEACAHWLIFNVGVFTQNAISDALLENEFVLADFMACKTSGDALEDSLNLAQSLCGDDVCMPRTRARILAQQRETKGKNVSMDATPSRLGTITIEAAAMNLTSHTDTPQYRSTVAKQVADIEAAVEQDNKALLMALLPTAYPRSIDAARINLSRKKGWVTYANHPMNLLLKNAQDTKTSNHIIYAASHGDLDSLQLLQAKGSLNPFYAEKALLHALGAGYFDTAEWLFPHADRYHPIDAVNAVLDSLGDGAIQSERQLAKAKPMAIQLVHDLPLATQESTLFSLIAKVSASGCLDVLKPMCQLMQTLDLEDAPAQLRLALDQAVTYGRGECAQWLMAVMNADPEPVFIDLVRSALRIGDADFLACLVDKDLRAEWLDRYEPDQTQVHPLPLALAMRERVDQAQIRSERANETPAAMTSAVRSRARP